jgi:hypothetical protein
MTRFDLWLAWNWEYDSDFVALLASACQASRLAFLSIRPGDLEQVVQSIGHGEASCRVFWDRASDSDDRFLPLVQWARDGAARRINAYEVCFRAWDKTIMHQLLAGIMRTPATHIVPAYSEQTDLPPLDLSALGSRFSVKPARRGGGEGVVVGATSLDQVRSARQEYPDDRYLLQAHVEPPHLGSRPAWFRVIHALGRVFPCWWDAHTHVYTRVTAAEETQYDLVPLRALAMVIAERCQLDIFSTEIALTADGSLVVVDYVNDPLDLRLQSLCADGVPDAIVAGLIERVVWLASRTRHEAGDP